MTPFQTGLGFILRPEHEGRVSTDPKDPGNWTGGKVGVGILRGTNRGISAASYPLLDIQALTLQDVTAIYEKDFWNFNRCGEFAAPVAVLVFDSAVNQGPKTAGLSLQAAINVVSGNVLVDGSIGPKTAAAANKVPASSLKEFIAMIVAERAFWYATAGEWDADPANDNLDKEYGRGWFRRLARCHQLALEL